MMLVGDVVWLREPLCDFGKLCFIKELFGCGYSEVLAGQFHELCALLPGVIWILPFQQKPMNVPISDGVENNISEMGW